jgi:hypothetical protein
MIVPSMSIKEIVNEILEDYESVHKKVCYTVKEVERNLIKSKKYPFVRVYDYVTPKRKNNWIYLIEVRGKRKVFVSFINYHYTNKGLRVAWLITEEKVALVNGHLFSRFAEREFIDITNPIDIIKEFFVRNPQIVIRGEKVIENGVTKIFGTTNTGVVVGTENEDKIYILKTYLPLRILKGNQVNIANIHKAQLEHYFSA